MNFTNKKVAITGASGFVGKALAEELEAKGAIVYALPGDVREAMTFARLDHTYDYLFHMGAPSSQVLFKQSPSYCIDVTIKGFMRAVEAAEKNGIRLIYPSTGLLSSGRFNEYAMCKKICEDFVAGKDVDATGVRIFATYGPSEGHKRYYASVPYIFARDLLNNKSPQVFGDGTQKRDFIYIEDTVQGLLTIAEEATERIVDLGSGKSETFNEVIRLAQHAAGNYANPDFIGSPAGYVEETHAEPNKYYQPKITLEQGIDRMIKQMGEELGL